MTNPNLEAVITNAVNEAKLAAHQASKALYDQMGGDRMACGFAWVEVRLRTNSKEAQILKRLGFTKSHRPRTLTMWNPGGLGVQNIDIKEAGAHAFAQVLNARLGLDAYANSRLD